MKCCIKCGIEKDLQEFNKRSDSIDGYRNDCRECRNKYYKEYSVKNKDILVKKDKEYRERNKDRIYKTNRIYWEENKEVLKSKKRKYYEENKDKLKKDKREYYKENKEKVSLQKKNYYNNNRYRENNRKNKWSSDKKKSDPLYKLRLSIRTLILISVKNVGYVKSQLRVTKTEKILGCTTEEFKIFLEDKFLEGMCWENHGEWHIDHICPVSYAKSEEDIIKLNHYTNFQPLWAVDNLSKGNRFIG